MGDFARAVIVSYKAKKGLRDLLKKLNIEIIETVPLDMDPRIGDHADLQVKPVDDDSFIVEPSTYEYYKDRLSKFGKRVLKGEKSVFSPYPNDCYYNVVDFKNFYICKKDIIETRLRDFYIGKGYREINVKQAYVKCMTLILRDCIITCDRGIYNKLKNIINIHYIEAENIALDGFSSGFLGGACGIISRRHILFTGSIDRMSYKENLLKILEENDFEAIYPNEDLVDLGSVFQVK
ncbi:DUF6873 family GME fold protein [Peptoniphilaceae bacterium SGI.131]